MTPERIIHKDKNAFNLCCMFWGANHARAIHTVATFSGIRWPKVVKTLWKNK